MVTKDCTFDDSNADISEKQLNLTKVLYVGIVF